MFAFVTACKSGGVTNGVTANAYYWRLDEWSNTYINFEMAGHHRVEIEISKVNGSQLLARWLDLVTRLINAK